MAMKRLPRLLAIALHLSARRRLKGEELAREFGVSLRTIYRDLQALQESGFPVTGSPGDGYRLPMGSQLRPLALEPGEAEVLVMGARLLERAVDAELKGRLQSALAKLEAVLSPETVGRLRDHRSRVLMPVLRSRAEGPLALVLTAVRERQVLEVAYHGVARDAVSRREIEPVGLIRLGTNWFVPAYCRLRNDMRTFRADRILEAKATGEVFEPRPGYTLEDVIRRERGDGP